MQHDDSAIAQCGAEQSVAGASLWWHGLAEAGFRRLTIFPVN